MENMNCAIVFHVFIFKTKYPIHIVIYVTILRGDNSGMTHPQAFERFKCKFERENNGRKSSWGMLPSL
jgi:hypothetical protein